jgi:hypothetical protein
MVNQSATETGSKYHRHHLNNAPDGIEVWYSKKVGGTVEVFTFEEKKKKKKKKKN